MLRPQLRDQFGNAFAALDGTFVVVHIGGRRARDDLAEGYGLGEHLSNLHAPAHNAALDVTAYEWPKNAGFLGCHVPVGRAASGAVADVAADAGAATKGCLAAASTMCNAPCKTVNTCCSCS